MRLVIFSPETLVRISLSAAISQQNDIDVIGEASIISEAYLLIQQKAPDVVLIDVRSPSSLGVIEQISAINSLSRIVVLSSIDEPKQIEDFLRAGAIGCVQFCDEPDAFLDVVRAVAETGQRMLSPRTAQLLADALAQGNDQIQNIEYATLTEHEVETLAHVAEGKTNKEIAGSLKISIKTVEKRLKSVFRKLEVCSRTEAVLVALQRKLISKVTPSSIG
jgi:DNA-binding NarL/FixJ family response regulator